MWSEKTLPNGKFEKSVECILELVVLEIFIYLSAVKIFVLQKYKKKRGKNPLFYIKLLKKNLLFNYN
tara:strand:- start:1516 stop:1716 length:201 start_codon:yes stop_codon:yes gene_type:complete